MIILTFTPKSLNSSYIQSSNLFQKIFEPLIRSRDLHADLLNLPASDMQFLINILFLEWFSSGPCCSECGCRLHRHGAVRRSIILNAESVVFSVCRVRCPLCGKTHRVLPSFFIPFLHNPVSDLDYVLRAADPGSGSDRPFPAGRTHSVFSWKEAAELLEKIRFSTGHFWHELRSAVLNSFSFFCAPLPGLAAAGRLLWKNKNRIIFIRIPTQSV